MGYALRGTPSYTFPTKESVKNNDPHYFYENSSYLALMPG